MNREQLNMLNQDYRRRAEVKHIKRDIVVDGNGDKAPWRQLKPIGELHYPWHKRGAIYRTEVKMLWSDDYFYVLYVCEDENIRSVRTHYLDAVFRDSCVEIFISPDADNVSAYYTFEMNCCGAMLNRHKDYLGKKSRRWYPAGSKIGRSIRSRTFRTADDPSVKSWTIELAIPFYLFDGATGKNPNPPRDGSRWRFNVMRCGDEVYKQFGMWSPSKERRPAFHRPGYFGEVVFRKGTR